MAFWCTKGGDRHQHESIAEMYSAHPDEPEHSAPAVRDCAPAPTLPATATRPAEPVPVAPTATVTEAPVVNTLGNEYNWIDRQPWHETKRQDARKFCMRNREKLPLPGTEWERWSEAWDAVVAVDANGREVTDPRLKLLKGMIALIPDGYYATQADDTATVDFIMLSRPNRGQYKDHIKVSTQHSENWMPRLAVMPNGRWLVLDRRAIEPLMLLVSDYRGCARRYAIEVQSCCVCNTTLTDDRSRHYLIGPICDKKPQWQHVIEEVDDLNGGLSYEDLVAKGLPTRVWQEHFFSRVS